MEIPWSAIVAVISGFIAFVAWLVRLEMKVKFCTQKQTEFDKGHHKCITKREFIESEIRAMLQEIRDTVIRLDQKLGDVNDRQKRGSS